MTTANPDRPLTEKEEVFVAEYLRSGLNRDHAAVVAYGDSAAGRAHGVRALQSPKIQREIMRRQNPPGTMLDERHTVAMPENFNEARVLQEWVDIATADPRELITHRRVNCRHCWGRDHQYQWRDAAEQIAAMSEWQHEQAEKMVRGKPADPCPMRLMSVDSYGFRTNKAPHPECPVCDGEGYGEVFLADFAKLSPKALRLLVSVKQSKTGIEVVMKSQEKAVENIAKYLGMLIERTKSEDAPPVPAINLTTEQLADLTKSLSDKY